MGKYSTLLLMFSWLLSVSSDAQSLLTDGFEWKYKHGYAFTPYFDFNKCSIVGDTIIEQQNCKIYQRSKLTCDKRPEYEYMYERDNQIFYYNGVRERFELLYDFTAQVGDTLKIRYWENFQIADSFFYIRIDSVAEFIYDTLMLKKYFVTYDKSDDEIIEFWSNKGEYIQGIGSLENFFYFAEDGRCDDSYNRSLRCIDHPIFGEFKFEVDPCDSTNFNSTSDVNLNLDFNIFPIPFEDHLTIKSNLTMDNMLLSIYNMNGHKVHSETIPIIHSNSYVRIHTDGLSGSIYLAVMSNYKGEVLFSEKIFKF